jgi:uncharacterized protein (DUF849 family)
MLVKACLNGGTTRPEHPAVPQLPDELAADAVAAIRAGAGAVHIHPRDASGAEALDPAFVLAAVGSIHAAIPGVPVGVTTGLWAAGGDSVRRLELVSGWNGPDKPEFASVNLSEPGAAELAALLGELGIAVEAGVWTVADADALAAAALADGGFGAAGQPFRILIEPQDRSPDGAVALAAAVDAALDRHGFTAPRLHHGYGAATWHVLRAAVAMGRDIRVGLEDTVVLADGTLAAGNAELVGAAVALAVG